MKKFDAIFNKVAINEADETESTETTPGDPFSKGEDWSNIGSDNTAESNGAIGDETPTEPDNAAPTPEDLPQEPMQIETKEDVQAVISSVKALWKYGVANDSLAVQRLIDPKDWQKFSGENGFSW